MEPERTVGVVMEKLSINIYIVKLLTGRNVELHLKARQVFNNINLPIGLKVHLELMPPNNTKGILLTSTDFKINNWPGGPSPDDY